MCESGTRSLKHTHPGPRTNGKPSQRPTNSKQNSTKKKGPLTVRRPLKILHLLRRKFRLRFPLSISLSHHTESHTITSPKFPRNNQHKHRHSKTKPIPPQTSFAKNRTNTLVLPCKLIDPMPDYSDRISALKGCALKGCALRVFVRESSVVGAGIGMAVVWKRSTHTAAAQPRFDRSKGRWTHFWRAWITDWAVNLGWLGLEFACHSVGGVNCASKDRRGIADWVDVTYVNMYGHG